MIDVFISDLFKACVGKLCELHGSMTRSFMERDAVFPTFPLYPRKPRRTLSLALFFLCTFIIPHHLGNI